VSATLPEPTHTERATDTRFYVFNAILSTGALAFLAWLLLLHRGGQSASTLSFMPAVNASLNATSAILLVIGYVAIRKKQRRIHQYMMVSAFASSALFLVGYLIYHWAHGDTKYVGAYRGLYLAILASHILLSAFVVPGCLSAFYFAWRKSFGRHRALARVLLPIWLYVSVTGVVVYFFLRTSS
jgi:putative membrane protein